MCVVEFKAYERIDKVRRVAPDESMARGLLRGARDDWRVVGRMRVDNRTASIAFKLSYDFLRCALQTLLALEGWKPYSHEAVFQYALEQGVLDPAEHTLADEARHLRHDIEYRGTRATPDDVRRLRRLVRAVLPRVSANLR